MSEVKEYYLNKGFNCAEACLRAANDRWKLGITQEDLKLLSAFGGGMGCGKTCGVLAAAMAVLGRMAVQENAHSTPDFRSLCGSFVRDFEAQTGGTDCKVLRPLYQQPDVRCLSLLEKGDALLQERVYQEGLAEKV